jgi:hypothetical protein
MIKIFSFIKNESHIINDWILYHSYLFGSENIYIIDQGSTDNTINILKKHKINISYTNEHFSKKSIVLTGLMKTAKNSFIIPLDADEFITLKENDKLTSNKESILSYFKGLPIGPLRYKFNQIDSIPFKHKLKDPILEINEFKTKWYDSWKLYAKTFYHSNFFISTDQGNHKGNVNGHGNNMKTDLTLIHYDVTDYDHFVKKTTKGAIAYNHHLSKTLINGNGKHYHRRYWAIQEGNGFKQMTSEFGDKGNYITNVISEKIKTLR